MKLILAWPRKTDAIEYNKTSDILLIDDLGDDELEENINEIFNSGAQPLKDEVLLCNACNYIFENEQDLKTHLEKDCKVHVENYKQLAEVDWENFECLKCSKIFANKRGIQFHIAKKYSCVKSPEIDAEVMGRFKYLKSGKECDKCDRRFPRISGLLNHLRRNASNLACGQPNIPEKLVREKEIRKKNCDDCGKRFSNPKNLAFHVDRAVCTRVKKNYTCNKCSKKFPDEKQLSRHMNRIVSCVSPKKHSVAAFLMI